MNPITLSLPVALALAAGCVVGYTARPAPAAADRAALAPLPPAPAVESRAEPPPAAIEARPRPDAAQIVAARIGLPRWDADRDALIDPAEFARGLFEMADHDDDGTLSAAEFEAARAWLPGDPDPETIARWDRDGDGHLDPQAFTAGVIIDQLDRGWDGDGDGRLTRAEVADGLRLAFDRDGDGQLQDAEQAPISRR